MKLLEVYKHFLLYSDVVDGQTDFTAQMLGLSPFSFVGDGCYIDLKVFYLLGQGNRLIEVDYNIDTLFPNGGNNSVIDVVNFINSLVEGLRLSKSFGSSSFGDKCFAPYFSASNLNINGFNIDFKLPAAPVDALMVQIYLTVGKLSPSFNYPFKTQ